MKSFTHLKMMFIVFGLFTLILISPQTVYAYLDPGTGSYILQIILAVLVALAFTIKTYWIKVRTFLLNIFPKISREGKDDDE